MTSANPIRRRRAGRFGAAGIVALVAAFSGTAAAHDFKLHEVLVLLRTDHTYQVDMSIDLDALALGVDSSADSAVLMQQLQAMPTDEFQRCVSDLQRMLMRRVRIRFDGAVSEPTLTFPDYGTPAALRRGFPSVLGTTARFVGLIPLGSREFTFFASRGFPPVHLTILDQATLSGLRHVLEQGEESPGYRIGSDESARNAASILRVAGEYLVLGFWHIVPQGLDHILFVLGLYLLSPRLRPLLWQVSAFTIAHSLTLALSMYGVVSLPTRVVEPLIAASIAYVAIENLLTKEMHPWRPALVFAFGLLHGLGFAGVLTELGLPRSEFVPALISFNAGVELGQLAVIAGAFACSGWVRARGWYRPAIAIPASVAIAGMGLFWSVERALSV